MSFHVFLLNLPICLNSMEVLDPVKGLGGGRGERGGLGGGVA